MLKKYQTIELIDDVDGSPATTTIEFSVGGAHYTIDLSDENAAKFQDALAPYVANGRRASSRKQRKPRSAVDRAKRQNAAEIRAWGIEKGYLKSTRGRLGKTVIDAYEAAHKER